MKIKTIEDRLIYMPKWENHEGQSVFDGKIECDNDLYAILKQEGVDYIKKKLLSIIENRKEMFGEYHLLHYGMNPTQCFYDMKNDISIRVKDLLLSKENKILLINEGVKKGYSNKSYKRKMQKIRGINTN